LGFDLTSEQKNHGDHGERKGKDFMEERFGASSCQVHSCDPRDPRDWALFRIQLKTGIDLAGRTRCIAENL
jgi:hypothetical protein